MTDKRLRAASQSSSKPKAPPSNRRATMTNPSRRKIFQSLKEIKFQAVTQNCHFMPVMHLDQVKNGNRGSRGHNPQIKPKIRRIMVPFGKVVRCPSCLIGIAVPQPQNGVQVQTASDTAETHQFGAETAELPVQEEERVTIAFAVP
ncbi:hypothetical protein DY000_02005583 [Brassica cretica]|uniref:Uncharacterized protein n=1 Tax=Brassica cretica TaxID=69181 RepID=A0ABQ7C1E5_BRACR|nr:hypothetical protein DY000_02005583 [Brassica cretica]